MIIMFARWTSGTTTMLINPFGVRRMSARVLICARSRSFHASRFRGRGSNNHSCSIGSWIFRTLKSKKKIRKKITINFKFPLNFSQFLFLSILPCDNCRRCSYSWYPLQHNLCLHPRYYNSIDYWYWTAVWFHSSRNPCRYLWYANHGLSTNYPCH